jgi:hypothetical protein
MVVCGGLRQSKERETANNANNANRLDARLEVMWLQSAFALFAVPLPVA